MDDEGSASTPSVSYVLVTDNTAPADVTNFSVFSESEGSLTLSWTESLSTDASGYKVYQRFQGAGAYSLVKQVTENSIGIGSLSTVRVYDFKVTTLDGAGNESDGKNSNYRCRWIGLCLGN